MINKLVGKGKDRMAIADSVTGIITISVFGVTAALTPKDASAWGDVFMNFAPLLLICFLIWRLRILDKQLSKCEIQHQESSDRYRALNEKLLLAYAAIRNPGHQRLPDIENFNTNNFDLKQCLDDSCEVPNANSRR